MSDLMITEGDVESFRRKLDTWGATLTDAEQAILQMISVRAFPDGRAPEVEGFMQDLRVTKKYDLSSPTLLATFGPGTLDQFIGASFKVDKSVLPPGSTQGQ